MYVFPLHTGSAEAVHSDPYMHVFHSFYCFDSTFSYRANWCKMPLAQVGIESWDSHLLLEIDPEHMV